MSKQLVIAPFRNLVEYFLSNDSLSSGGEGLPATAQGEDSKVSSLASIVLPEKNEEALEFKTVINHKVLEDFLRP